MLNDSSVEWYDIGDDLQQKCASTKFQWQIDSFSSLPKEVDEFYESPVFSSPGFTWCLRIFPNGEKMHSSEEWIGLYLVRCDGPGIGFICEVDFVAGIVNTVNGTVELQKGIYKSIISGKSGKGWIRFLEKDVLARRKSEFYPSDALTISIWLQHKICDNFETETVSTKIGNIKIGDYTKEKIGGDSELKGLNMLSNSLKKLFLDGEDCDVVFHIKEKMIKAHKLILKARSKVLSSMLLTNMNVNVIKIHDCDLEAFEIFLLYLYSGKIEKLSDTNMLDVFYVANKYGVADLKAECVSYISGSLSVKNICNVFCAARKNDDSELLECATDYFVRNVHKILHTNEWKSFLKYNPKYGNELHEKAVTKLEI